MIEAATPEGVRGWAVNDLDLEERLTVEIRDGERVVASGRAERPRPDLLDAGLGDGRYGFVIDVTSDCFLSPLPQPLAVVGIDGEGNEAAGTYVNAGRLDQALATFRDAAYPSIAGASFLLDNLHDYSPTLLAPSVAGVEARFLAVRMYGFGDFMWWDAESGQVPTAARFFSTIGEASRQAIADRSLP